MIPTRPCTSCGERPCVGLADVCAECLTCELCGEHAEDCRCYQDRATGAWVRGRAA